MKSLWDSWVDYTFFLPLCCSRWDIWQGRKYKILVYNDYGTTCIDNLKHHLFVQLEFAIRDVDKQVYHH